MKLKFPECAPRHFFTALVLLIGFSIPSATLAQLYSSGNNYSSGGRVGIGEQTPAAMLHINNSYWESGCTTCQQGLNAPTLRLQTSSICCSTTVSEFWDIDSRTTLKLSYTSPSNQETTVMKLSTTAGEILSTTSLFSSALHVSAPLISSVQTYQIGLGVKYGTSGWEPTMSNGVGSAIQSGSNGELKFLIGASGTNPTPKMTITYDGKIGIGTASPAYKLEIASGGAKVGGTLYVSSGDVEIKSGRFVIKNSGNANEFSIENNGYVRAREVKVDATTIPDYVFDSAYDLMPIETLRAYVLVNKHLPNIPSAAEYAVRDGVQLGELSLKLLEKQEELLLYILQLEERISDLESCIE